MKPRAPLPRTHRNARGTSRGTRGAARPGERSWYRRNPRKKPIGKSEFGFTEKLSAATILVPQAMALHAAETDGNSAARVDTAEMAVVFSITCCITTRHREPTSKPPIPAPPRCVRFLCSYLLPNQQVRDEPACKQQTHRNSSKTRTRPGAGFFISGPGFRRNHHDHRLLHNLDLLHHEPSWWQYLCDARRCPPHFSLTGRYVASTAGRLFLPTRKEPPP